MEFGKLSAEELTLADLSLPKDPLFNSQILKGKKVKSPKVYIGCAKWGRKDHGK